MNHKGKPELNELKWTLIGILGKWIIDLLFLSTKIEQKGLEKVQAIIDSRRFIAAIWHSRILLISYLYQHLNAAILVSQSEDGEVIARILQHQGHDTIRGSTTRGGLQALAKIIRSLKDQKRPACIIPDGPQGPRFKVQPGIIALAKKTGYPIIPMTYSAKRIKIFQSWDRFILPFPFTTCKMIYGNIINVPKNIRSDEIDHYCLVLERELCRITEQADRTFNHRID